MEELTTEQIATIFSLAAASVTLINAKVAKSSLTDDDKDKLQRNVKHLELIKAYKKVDGTTSIWTSEDFTAINAAVTNGNAKLSA